MPMRIREITEIEMEQLQQQLVLSADQTPARKAKAVLMASNGTDAGAIAIALGVSERNVRHIIKRFNDQGLNTPSSGRPRLISHSQREAIIHIIRRSPEDCDIPADLWNCADILAVAQAEGILGDISYWTFRREVARILDIESDLQNRLSLADQKRPGAPHGNSNAIRHGAYAGSKLCREDRDLIADVESRFLSDFPESDDADLELIRDIAESHLMFLRAAGTNSADATLRADRQLKKALKELKARDRQCRQSKKITLAEWMSDLIEQYKKSEAEQKQ